METKNNVIEKETTNEIIEIQSENNLSENQQNKNFTFIPIEQKKESSIIFIFGILLFIFLIFLLIIFSIFTYSNLLNTKIFSGIYVKGIDISELTKEEAMQKIQNNIYKNIPEEITLKHLDYETSISTSDLEIKFDIQSAVNAAYEIGRTDSLLKNNLIIIKAKLLKINVEPNFTINEKKLKEFLNGISSNLPDCTIESSYYIENNKLIITKGKTGNIVSTDDMISLIKSEIYSQTLNSDIQIITLEKSPSKIDINQIYEQIHKTPKDAYYTQNPYTVYPSENGLDFSISLQEASNILNEDKEEYIIPLKILYPNVTTNMIGTEAFPDLLSTFSTKYAISNKNRTTNLILASNKINGTVIMPGETFSYNTVVGERTIEAGYKEAAIYVNGEVVDGLGGGICQITTTLYNAVLYANLEIVERKNHQFVPSYVGASRDATVVYGLTDFKFKNNRNYPIKITCSVSGGTAKFNIYGIKTNNDYEVIISNRITSSTSNSLISEAYKTLKQNGKIISTEKLSRDYYKKH